MSAEESASFLAEYRQNQSDSEQSASKANLANRSTPAFITIFRYRLPSRSPFPGLAVYLAVNRYNSLPHIARYHASEKSKFQWPWLRAFSFPRHKAENGVIPASG